MNTFLLYGTVNLLTKLLPRRACYAVARRASGLAYRYNRAVRNALAANLRVVLHGRDTAWTEPELEQLVRRNFANFGKYVVDFFQTGRLSPQALDAMLEVEHIEYLEQCLAMRRGIIGLTAHVGNWELGAAVLDRHGCRVNAVVRNSLPQGSIACSSRSASGAVSTRCQWIAPRFPCRPA